jgi:hypothetical protein
VVTGEDIGSFTAQHAERAEKSKFLLAIAKPLNSADVPFSLGELCVLGG